MTTPSDHNEISRRAWDANAEHWDARMGDEGNDFFNVAGSPPLFTRTLHNILNERSVENFDPAAIVLFLVPFTFIPCFEN